MDFCRYGSMIIPIKEEYPFYVNGQTGKLVGTAPISKAKVWACRNTWCDTGGNFYAW